MSHLDAFVPLSLLNWRTVHSFVPFELFHQLRAESFCILVSLSHFQVFFSGYALYFHWTIFIISLIRLLGISNEGLHRRYWLLYVYLQQKYWNFHLTPFENPQRWMGQNTFPILLLNDDNMIGEH